MRWPILPSPMMPRAKPLGLCVMAAMLRLASTKRSGWHDRADRLLHVNLRKVDSSSQMAASATDSVQAAAALQ